MLVRKLCEINEKVIFEQLDFEKRSFFSFLFNLKRSEKYEMTILGFSFFTLMTILANFTLPRNQFSWYLIIYITLSAIIFFAFAQFQEWIKCYLIEDDEIFFGYVIGKKCYFTIKRNLSDINDLRDAKDFSQYLFIFNHGFVNYSLTYSKTDLRKSDLKNILRYVPQLLKKV